MSVLDDLVQKYGLDKLNSATQYPSIITYHNLGDRGGLTNSLRFTDDEPLPNDNLEVSATEKIDGTNSRIVVLGDDFFIGSRNDFVHAKGDRVVTNDAVTPVYMGLTNFLSSYTPSEDRLLVLFGEAYGRKINGAKCYTENAKPGFRLFDGFTISIDELTKLFEENDLPKIASWRDHLHQPFWPESTFHNFCNQFNLQRTPDVWKGTLGDIPKDPAETYEWLNQFRLSQATLDEKAVVWDDTNLYGRSEGIVVRDKERRYIRKLRFEDYNKGKKNGWKAKK